MRIMRKSFFLFELGAGIALFLQGKISRQRSERRLSKLPWVVLCKRPLCKSCWLLTQSYLEIRLSINLLSILTLFFLQIQWTNRVFYILKSANWGCKVLFFQRTMIRKDEIRYLSFFLLVTKGMPVVTLTLLQDAFVCVWCIPIF